jgi:phosphatidyl-myo-inositol dimannoside synthase
MTTLLISEIFPPKTGGSGRWFWEVYRRLPREEFLIAAGEDPRQLEFDQTHDLRVVRLPLGLDSWGLRSVRGLWGYWQANRKLRPLVRSAGVRMVHCGRCLPEGLMALTLKSLGGPPYVCYVHGEEMNYASASRELGWLTRRVLRGANFLIANSHNTARLLREEWGLPPEQVRLLHPGVDTRRFVPAERDPGVRAELGWGERPVLLTVGRLQKRKGQDHMIRALRKVRQAIPDILYVIIGDGEERGYLEELVTREGLDEHVRLAGEVDDRQLIRCYQQCDLFVLANRQVGKDIEGFGMVLLEAQACGKPVIAGKSGGTGETMQVPETGRLVDGNRLDELADTVVELLTDPGRLARMGKAARKWTVEGFDWTALSEQAAELFGVGGRRAGPANAPGRFPDEAVAADQTNGPAELSRRNGNAGRHRGADHAPKPNPAGRCDAEC